MSTRFTYLPNGNKDGLEEMWRESGEMFRKINWNDGKQNGLEEDGMRMAKRIWKRIGKTLSLKTIKSHQIYSKVVIDKSLAIFCKTIPCYTQLYGLETKILSRGIAPTSLHTEVEVTRVFEQNVSCSIVISIKYRRTRRAPKNLG